jgi:hypothetical protein
MDARGGFVPPVPLPSTCLLGSPVAMAGRGLAAADMHAGGQVIELLAVVSRGYQRPPQEIHCEARGERFEVRRVSDSRTLLAPHN